MQKGSAATTIQYSAPYLFMSFLNRAAQISKIQQKEQLAVRTFFSLYLISFLSFLFFSLYLILSSLLKSTVCKLLKTTNL